MKICKKCLMLSTRPRVTYNDEGVCNACQWAEEKKAVNWKARKEQLIEYCEKYRSKNGGFDCIVPVSGGKDSSMVAHKLKFEHGMTPLCVNISHSPSVNTLLNDENLNNFINQGFDCLRIYPNPTILQAIDKIGLIQYGQPYLGWLTAMSIAPIKLAVKYNIPFIVYGEDGEVEYGGSTKLKNTPIYGMDEIINFYLSGIKLEKYKSMFRENALYWWETPLEEQIKPLNIALAHWSYFEPWDSNYNFEYAKKHAGLKSQDCNSSGTYNNFAQTDSILLPLHAYFMYLKFGFGRCTQDACIDIRAGRLSRTEGMHLVERLDEIYPSQFEQQYLEYYQMTHEEFHNNIDKWANKDILVKNNDAWVKSFNIRTM